MPTNSNQLLHPELPLNLKRVRIPIVEASEKTLEGYGYLVEKPEEAIIEIVQWPAKSWRNVDPDTGDEGGTTEGIFAAEWKGDVLYGSNEAVSRNYTLGYRVNPENADESHQRPPERLMIWHANYHPDGGQLFYPLEKKPFLCPLALPGDDIQPKDFLCFRFDGNHGLYIHPDIWHEGIFPYEGKQRFFDKQGAIHARVSMDFAREFGCLLEIPLTPES
jgi:hypothetical protein